MTQSKSTHQYSAPIDGLRAIAVFSVILFHLDFTQFRGGYIGVDVFFVISGFLISRIIFQELEKSGRFDLQNFYSRRIRRIFPAFFFTLLISSFASTILLPSPLFNELGKSFLYSASGIPNIYFFQESGYFEDFVKNNPILHTWSLGVEEQFYLVWPLICIVFYKYLKKIFFPLIISLGLLSFYLNYAYIEGVAENYSYLFPLVNNDGFDKNSAIFYLMPFRIFEFTIGALIVIVPSHYTDNKKLQTVMGGVGLAMILFSAIYYNSGTVFPYYNALIPCIGAALVILGREGRLTKYILGNRIVRGIGLVSYSLYLAHFPLIVFYKALINPQLHIRDQLILMATSLFVATLMYRYIETPFRKPPGKGHDFSRVGAAVTIVTCMSLFISSHIWNSQIKEFAITDTPTRMLQSVDLRAFQNHVFELLTQIDINKVGQKKRWLVFGDSQSGDFINVLHATGLTASLSFTSFTIHHQCQIYFRNIDNILHNIPQKVRRECKIKIERLRKIIEEKKYTNFILSFSWLPWSLRDLQHTLSFFSENGAKVVIVTDKYQDLDGIDLLNIAKRTGKPVAKLIPPSKQTLSYNNMLKKNAGDTNIIDLNELFCTNEGCKTFTPSGNILFYDNTHITAEGARYLGKKLSANKAFMAMLR